MNCKICNNYYNSNRPLGIHIRATHHITIQQYYDQYYKSDTDGICANCGNITNFINLTKGYRRFCSKTCCNLSEEHKTKMVNTIVTKYGGMGTASTVINNKIKHTNLLKYNSENLYSSEYGKQKIKETCLERFGVEYAFQAPSVKNKIIQTSLEKYNTSNPANCKSGRQKAAITRRSNDNDSSWEDYFEKQLIKLHITYKKRYDLDNRYPYYCDFYLPDTDTFIEINGYWSHGKYWFNKNVKRDQEKLAIWINKANNGHKQYKNAINVWTVKDVKKRKAAKKHKLNYIVLWTFDDITNFFEKSYLIRKEHI